MPISESGQGSAPAETLLEVEDLRQWFPMHSGFFRRISGWIKAVDGVSFDLRRNEVLGLVGESGCGKTTVGRSILRLYEPTGGAVRFRSASGNVVDVATLPRRELKPLRREMRMIFQDPFSSLNPRFPISEIIGEPLVIHGEARGRELERRVRELMQAVGLDPALMGRYPHEFSGGQRQRIGLARTLALSPRLVIADEPVSALDVSIQAQVLNLLQQLRRQLGLTMLFISHDLAVVEHICDRIAVMYVGKIVELAPTDELLARPRHPYTEALVSAVLPADPDIRLKRILLEGDVPSPADPPAGCRFHPRCPYAQEICRHEEPPLQTLAGSDGREVACHFAEELELQGVASTPSPNPAPPAAGILSPGGKDFDSDAGGVHSPPPEGREA